MKRMRSSSRTSLVVVPLFLCLCFLFMVEAQGKSDRKGSVVSIRGGKLERLEGSSWKDLIPGQDVLEGNRLRTDKTALAVIEFSSIGRFVMGPSSEMEMGKDPKDFRTKMDRGALWVKSNLPKGNRVSVTTSLATAGIRGTAFSIVFGENAVCVCTCSGKVEAVLKDGLTIKVPKGNYLPVVLNAPAPQKSQTSIPLLEKTDTVFDFCFNCHIVGGKGKLEKDRE